jgi:hypothetical protein
MRLFATNMNMLCRLLVGRNGITGSLDQLTSEQLHPPFYSSHISMHLGMSATPKV